MIQVGTAFVLEFRQESDAFLYSLSYPFEKTVTNHNESLPQGLPVPGLGLGRDALGGAPLGCPGRPPAAPGLWLCLGKATPPGSAFRDGRGRVSPVLPVWLELDRALSAEMAGRSLGSAGRGDRKAGCHSS